MTEGIKQHGGGEISMVVITLNNNNNNNQRQCLWCYPRDHGHCESSPGSFDECRLSAGWPPTLRPSQPTCAASLPINGCYHPHPPSPFVIEWKNNVENRGMKVNMNKTKVENVRSQCRRLQDGRVAYVAEVLAVIQYSVLVVTSGCTRSVVV